MVVVSSDFLILGLPPERVSYLDRSACWSGGPNANGAARGEYSYHLFLDHRASEGKCLCWDISWGRSLGMQTLGFLGVRFQVKQGREDSPGLSPEGWHCRAEKGKGSE